MRFQVIPGTGGEVKFRFWFSISKKNVTIIYHMLKLGRSHRIPSLLLSQKSSKSVRRWVGMAPSVHPRNSLSDWGTSAFWKLLVNAITCHRAVAEKCCIQLKILIGL